MKTQRFKIGTKYTLKRKNSKQDKTIVDVYKTYNSDNELIKIEYACVHKFMGQDVASTATDTEIARALFDMHGTLDNHIAA